LFFLREGREGSFRYDKPSESNDHRTHVRMHTAYQPWTDMRGFGGGRNYYIEARDHGLLIEVIRARETFRFLSAKSLTCANLTCCLLFAKMMDRLHQSASLDFISFACKNRHKS